MTSPAHIFMPLHSKLAAEQSAATPLDKLQALQDRVAGWQDRTFPDQPLAGKLAHLEREARELRNDPNDLDEWADVLILLLGSAAMRGLSVEHLLAAAEHKFSVAQKRQWGPADSEGVHHHIG